MVRLGGLQLPIHCHSRADPGIDTEGCSLSPLRFEFPSGQKMRQIRATLLTRRPEHVPGIGPTWTRIESDQLVRSFRQRRNGLVHGSASADPRVLSRGVDLIRDAIISELLADMRIRIRSGDRSGTTERVGEILTSQTPRAGSRRGTGSTSQVTEWLRG